MEYTLEYIQSLEGIEREKKVGGREAWHDTSLKQWRLRVQLEPKAYWFLSVLINDDGRFDTFFLDEEAADDSHYGFTNEKAIRKRLYQPGDERLLLDEILARYARENGGSALYWKLIRRYVTEQYHYCDYDDYDDYD